MRNNVSKLNCGLGVRGIKVVVSRSVVGRGVGGHKSSSLRDVGVRVGVGKE